MCENDNSISWCPKTSEKAQDFNVMACSMRTDQPKKHSKLLRELLHCASCMCSCTHEYLFLCAVQFRSNTGNLFSHLIVIYILRYIRSEWCFCAYTSDAAFYLFYWVCICWVYIGRGFKTIPNNTFFLLYGCAITELTKRVSNFKFVQIWTN